MKVYGFKTIRRLKNLSKLKDSCHGKILFIIGNGPSSASFSISQYEFMKNQGTVFIALNAFWDSPLSRYVIPDFLVVIDPEFFFETKRKCIGLRNYIEAYPNVTLVTFAKYDVQPKSIFLNGVSAVGLWNGSSPLLPTTSVQAVFLEALKFANFLSPKMTYVIGVEHSQYLLHKHLGSGIIKVDALTMYSHEPNESEATQDIIPFLTRNMADVSYAQSILLRDMYRFNNKMNIVNVGLDDFTNDAFPRACLLP
jgi:hypothetical protein